MTKVAKQYTKQEKADFRRRMAAKKAAKRALKHERRQLRSAPNTESGNLEEKFEVSDTDDMVFARNLRLFTMDGIKDVDFRAKPSIVFESVSNFSKEDYFASVNDGEEIFDQEDEAYLSHSSLSDDALDW